MASPDKVTISSPQLTDADEEAVLAHEFAVIDRIQLLTPVEQQAIKDSASAEGDAIIADTTTAYGLESQELLLALSLEDLEAYLEDIEDKLYERVMRLRTLFLRGAVPKFQAGDAVVERDRDYAETCLKLQLSIAMLPPFEAYKESCLEDKLAEETPREDAASRRRARRQNEASKHKRP